MFKNKFSGALGEQSDLIKVASGTFDVMDCCCPLSLNMFTVFLLLHGTTVCLHGNPVTGLASNLHCVNDYLFTINCSLSIASDNTSDSNSSYWLSISDANQPRKYTCLLTDTSGDYFCSVKISDYIPDDIYDYIFDDTQTFKISLCHKQNELTTCRLLDKGYTPHVNIKPNTPCCLVVSRDQKRWNFTWESTYKEYSQYTGLTENLMYQLHYYERGGENNASSRTINTDSLSFSVHDAKFVADTECAARVRSSPNQVHYKGEWSDWSSEVHWKPESAVNRLTSNQVLSGLCKVFIPLCIMVPLLLLFYTSVKKWRKSAYIPTPAPYFHTLYKDCQGDFRSWVVTQHKTADFVKAEETLHIDRITKCVEIQKLQEVQPHFHHQATQESTYCNIPDPSRDLSLLGMPYIVSTMAPSAAPGSSSMRPTLDLQPEWPAEEGSGCWHCSHASPEWDGPIPDTSTAP